MRLCLLIVWSLVGLMVTSCMSRSIGTALPRRGQEIVVAGQLFHVGAPVVLWTDPGGYDAYRTEKRFVPWKEAAWGEGGEKNLESPNRYGLRKPLDDAQLERVRGGGWTLPELQQRVDQFVIHYDVCGTSRTCFRVLHDLRGLSVHFMLDIDGTIYQTLDVKERAWHATIANDRSVGIEIANIGAYPIQKGPPGPEARFVGGPNANLLSLWYGTDELGTRITVPARLDGGGVRTPDFVGRPARPEPVIGTIQGQELQMYDLTPQQYESLIKLTAALHVALPRIELDYPRDETGQLVTKVLSKDEFEKFNGVLGHFHIQSNKTDPGPAFRFDYVMEEAKRHVERPSSEN